MTEDAAEGTGVVENTPTDNTPAIGKEAIYRSLTDMIANQTGKRVSQAFAKSVFNHVVERSLETAVQEGSIRFNGGFGSLKVRDLKGGTRQLPSGQTVAFGERKKIRYEHGLMVEAMMGNSSGTTTGDAPAGDAPPPSASADSGDVMEGIE